MNRTISVFLLCICCSLESPAGSATIDSLRHLAETADDTIRVQAFSRLADEYAYSFPDTAIAFSLKALDLAHRLGDRDAEAEALSSLGFAYSSMTEYKQALNASLQSLQISRQTGNRIREASALSVLGIVYGYLGQYSKALKYHFEALKIKEGIGKPMPVAATLNNIGIVYGLVGQEEKACDYYRKTLTIRTAACDTDGIVMVCNNLAIALQHRTLYDSAAVLLLRARTLAQLDGFQAGITYSDLNLGNNYTLQQNPLKAIPHLQSSHRVYESSRQWYGAIQSLNSLAEACGQLGQVQRAIALLEQSAATGEKHRVLEPTMRAYELLTRMNERAGRTAQALASFRSYRTIRDTIFGQKESGALIDMSFEYDSEKRQRDIALLEKNAAMDAMILERKEYQNMLLRALLTVLVMGAAALLLRQRWIRKSRMVLQSQQAHLAQFNRDLEEKIAQIKLLKGLLPICSHCKKIRNDAGYWTKLEEYVVEHTDASFSHGICPPCTEILYPEVAALRRKNAGLDGTADQPAGPDKND